MGRLHADTMHVGAFHYKIEGWEGHCGQPMEMEADRSAMFRWSEGRLATNVRLFRGDQNETPTEPGPALSRFLLGFEYDRRGSY